MKPTNMKHRANGALIDSVAHGFQPRVLFQELVSIILALISDLLPEAEIGRASCRERVYVLV